MIHLNHTVEDQKELPSVLNPELRHKEVQMNFFNQLTSVFNPDLTTLLSSPSASHTQVNPLTIPRLASTASLVGRRIPY